MITTFNVIITRFRWVLFDYMEKFPNMSLIDIFRQIEEDADLVEGKKAYRL